VEIVAMKSIIGWLATFILCAVLAASPASAQIPVVAQACTKDGKQYMCEKANFQKLLHVSKTVSVRTPRLQPYAGQLSALLRSLGKTIQHDSSDLTFVIARSEPDGIYYGPSDRELAAIRVYYGEDGNGPGTLVWVESYYGQPDTAWPIVVNHLAEQFREKFKR
jgi:hypothetical protein